MGYLRKIKAFNTLRTVSGYNYRVYDEHIEFMRGDYWFVVNNGKIGMSVDNGGSIINSMDFADYQKIEFSYIFSNGNLIFATQNKVYKSTDYLASITEITVYDIDGSEYSNVANSTNYRNIAYHVPVYQNGVEILVWGNYTNYGFANTNVNIYYTTANLTNVIIVYQFGYNSTYPNASGNENNNIICRHVHAVNWDSYIKKYWICTGDGTNECHWITLDPANWSSEVIKSGNATSYYKSGSLFFDENYIYWIADVDEEGNLKNGVWRCLRTGLDNEDNFVNLLETGYPMLPGFCNGNDVVVGYTWLNGIVNTVEISRNKGQSFSDIAITEGLSTDVTYLRPYITNNMTRMDAKDVADSAGSYNYYQPTVLLYL